GGLRGGLGSGGAALRARAGAPGRAGQTVVFVARDGRLAGLLGVADPIRPTTLHALDALRAAGVRVGMVTGDDPVTAEAVARELGIHDVHAGVLPDRKAEIVRELRSRARAVAMAGDGINDAPAL